MKRQNYIIDYVKKVRVGGSILDIGCADMPEISLAKPTLLHNLISKAADKSVSVLGYDYNIERVRDLNESGFNCIYGDILNVSIDRKFDLIIAGEIIEHIKDQELFILGIKKLLDDQGTALISTPNPSGVLSVLGYWFLGSECGGDGHLLWQSPKTFKRLCVDNGLVLQKVIHCDWDYPEFWMFITRPFEIISRMKPTLLFVISKK